MKNTLYTDADLAVFLLSAEEQTGNTIEIVIDADNTPDQELTITAGDATTTAPVTPGTKNTIEIPSMLWNFGDDTTATLSKDGTDAETITIHFPAAIDSDASLNYNAANEYTMQGSAGVQQQLVSLQDSVERISAQTLAYILPTAISQADIADGGSNTVETFEFEAGAENVKVAFFTCIQFLASTTIAAGNVYEDLDATITFTLDGNAIATILHTYRDGRQVLTLNHLVENLSKGNHTLTIELAAAGGSVSVMQIIAAYLLTAKSTSEGTTQTQVLFENGQWAPGVLADGLDQNKLTEEAMLNGVESSVIKYTIAQDASYGPSGQVPDISTLTEYFLSEYILLAGQYYYEPFYLKENYYRKQGVHGKEPTYEGEGNTSTHFYIPIKRVAGFKKIQFDAIVIKQTQHTEYNIAQIAAGAVVDGVMQKVVSTSQRPLIWTTYTFDISSIPYVDYIILYGADGSPAYRNIKLLKS